MTARLRAWLNSMQAHMIAFAFGAIMLLTAMNVAIVVIAGPPQLSPMTIYDVSRVVRGLQPARSDLTAEFTRSTATTAQVPASQAERQLSVILAKNIGRAPDDVRIYLGNRSPSFLRYGERQARLFEQEGGGSPVLSGTVVAAVRQPGGHWNVYVRRSKTGFENYWTLLRTMPWLGFLIVVPLAMWFSTMISRPVRAFALAASRVRNGRIEFPVPVEGPNEIRVAAAALNDMQARIRDYLRDRTAMVGAIAHDLRTPLNNLRFRIAGAPDEIRVAAENDIKQLEQLINSTLEYVEADGMILSIELIDLPSLLESIADNNAYLKKEIAFEFADVRIEGDILTLRRLFANLIGNALKFASRVAITLRSTAEDAIVEILDDGPGMSASDLDRAFEPFFRGERSRSRATGGIGLGLSIARSVAEAHGGTVTLENAPQGGLLARVTLPLKHPGELGAKGAPSGSVDRPQA